MKTYNILITGVGAIIGYGIINSLKNSAYYKSKIIGMDIYPDAYGKFLCDSFYQAVPAYSKEYPDFIKKLIKKENIDLIIPGIEQDMYRLWELKREMPVRIVLNNDLLVKLSQDKLATYNFFKDKGVSLIKTCYKLDYYACYAQLGIPFLLKPRSSYASKGIHIIHNQEEFDRYNIEPDNNIFQKIVGSENEEYTVSIFGDGEGDFDDYIIMRRKLAQSGATDKAKVIIEDQQIMDYVKNISAITKPFGPTNIQLRKDKTDGVLLLEINPRISSACSIRTAAGYNEPEKCIGLYLEKKHLDPLQKKSISAVRYVADYIF